MINFIITWVYTGLVAGSILTILDIIKGRTGYKPKDVVLTVAMSASLGMLLVPIGLFMVVKEATYD